MRAIQHVDRMVERGIARDVVLQCSIKRTYTRLRGQQRIINSTLASEGWIAGWLQGIEKPGIIPRTVFGRCHVPYSEDPIYAPSPMIRARGRVQFMRRIHNVRSRFFFCKRRTPSTRTSDLNFRKMRSARTSDLGFRKTRSARTSDLDFCKTHSARMSDLNFCKLL